MDNPASKRRHERHPVLYPADVKRLTKLVDTSVREAFSGTVVDISKAGLKLQLKELLYPKEQVHITVTQTRTEFGLSITAIVRWCQKVTGGYEAGVEFVNVEKIAQTSGGGNAGASEQPPTSA